MTKQSHLDHDSARQAGALSKEIRQSFEDCLDISSQLSQRAENGSALERLTLTEGYVKGALNIVLEYRDRALCDADLPGETTFFYLSYDGTAVGVDDLHASDEGVTTHWQDALMLVSDVETMQIPKVVLPAREGLSIGADVISDGFGRAVPCFYSSINGAFDARPVFTERESAPIGETVPICFDQNAVCVIERSPEIMDRIAQDGWRMARRFREPDFSPEFECALLMLGAKTLSVFCDVSPQKKFELVDVLIGPFYLE